MTGEIVLHDYWRSSASYRVRIALGLAGLDWRSVAVDLTAGAQTAPAHRALSPQGLVPVLEIDGLVLTQSLAIIDYLEATCRLALGPEGAADRAHSRAAALAIAAEIHPVCNLRTVARVERLAGADVRARWMQEVISEGLAAVEAMLPEPAPHAFGDRLSLADLCIVPQLYNARRWGVALDDLPRLTAIDAAAAHVPAVAAAHPDRARPAPATSAPGG